MKGTDTTGKRRRPKLQPRSEVDKENAVPSCDNDSAKENEPPHPPEGDDQWAPPPSAAARPTAGVLQPATNVPFVPLEVQEAVLDEDERRQELAMAAEEAEVGRGWRAVNRVPGVCPMVLIMHVLINNYSPYSPSM